jgi:hypothetical protein
VCELRLIPLRRYQWPSASLVYRDSQGHITFTRKGEATQAILDYLTAGTLPESGTVYPPGPDDV